VIIEECVICEWRCASGREVTVVEGRGVGGSLIASECVEAKAVSFATSASEAVRVASTEKQWMK